MHIDLKYNIVNIVKIQENIERICMYVKNLKIYKRMHKTINMRIKEENMQNESVFHFHRYTN